MTDALSPKAWLFLGGAAVISLAAASLAPLATYALTLATFGLVHVLTEIRYVDKRFAPRLPFGVTATWLLLIGAIVFLRLLRMADASPIGSPYVEQAELGLVVALGLGGLYVLRRASGLRLLVGIVVVAALTTGAWLAPLTTLVLLAVLHNLTPIGFLVERLRGSGRRTWLVGAGVLFVGVPAVIASGWLPSALGLDVTRTGPLGSGMLQDHAGVFLPARWLGGMSASLVASLFAAAAYLQCMHYAVVIGILPRLEPAGEVPEAYVRWPAVRRWVPALAVVAVVSLGVFAWSFRDARAFYGLFALVHAWVEVPVLIAALAPLPARAAAEAA